MIRRHAAARIRESLEDFPAVLLLGPRQVGKSTLALQLVAEGILERYVSLDDLAVLEAVRSDPDGFLRSLEDRVALDEVQRAPDLMRALKRSIDEKRRPGRFLLTGSANVLSRPGVTESLAGRVDVVPLEGLSVAEVEGRPGTAPEIEALIDADDWIDRLRRAARGAAGIPRQSFPERIFYGGFPEVVLKRSARFANRWFAAYLTTYVERDVRDLARLADVVAFGRFVRLTGLRTANLLNAKNLGADCGIDQRTAARYLEILELTFQASRLPPWQASRRKRLVKTPKVYLNDSGLACHLAGIDAPAGLDRHPAFGSLLETWAWAELRKAIALVPGVHASFYRTHQGKEVDFVLEKGSRRLGIEIKRAVAIGKSDLSGLEDMREAMGARSRGLLLYGGSEVVRFSDSLAAAPVAAIL